MCWPGVGQRAGLRGPRPVGPAAGESVPASGALPPGSSRCPGRPGRWLAPAPGGKRPAFPAGKSGPSGQRSRCRRAGSPSADGLRRRGCAGRARWSRAGVEVEGGIEIAGAQGGFKGQGVHPRRLAGIPTHLVAAHVQQPRGQRLAQMPEGLAKVVGRGLWGLVRPEQGLELFSTVGALPVQGQVGQQAQRLGLDGKGLWPGACLSNDARLSQQVEPDALGLPCLLGHDTPARPGSCSGSVASIPQLWMASN